MWDSEMTHDCIHRLHEKKKKLLLLACVVGLNSHLKIIFSKKLLKIKILITSLI